MDGLLTLIAVAYGRLGEPITLTRYPKQTRENVKKEKFAKRANLLSTDEGNKNYTNTVSPTAELFWNRKR